MDKDLVGEAVDHHTDQAVVKAELDVDCVAAVHAEHLLGIHGKVKFIDRLSAVGAFLLHRDRFHLIHTKMLELIELFIISDQVVVFIVPCQRLGRQEVAHTVVTAHLHDLLRAGAGYRPLRIIKADLALFIDSAVDRVDIAIDLLIRVLDAVGDDDLSVQLLRLILRGEGLDLVDQLTALFEGDELGALHRVDQELDLFERKVARHQAEQRDLADLRFDDIHTEITQAFDIIINALALGGDPVIIEIIDDIRDGHTVFLIGFL